MAFLDDDGLDWDDALADEMVLRVGNRQIAMREEEVAGLDDELGILGLGKVAKFASKALNPVSHVKHAVRGVSSLARGDIKGALDPGGFIFKKKKRSRRRSSSSRKRGGWLGNVTKSARKATRRAKSTARKTRPSSSRPSSSWAKAMMGGARVPMASMQARGGGTDPAIAMMMATMMKMIMADKVNQARAQVQTPKCAEPHLDKIATQVESNLDPKLKDINARLRVAAIQRGATSEHNAISKRAAYRRRVLKNLVDIRRTPDCADSSEPARVLGNVLGNAGLVVTRPR